MPPFEFWGGNSIAPHTRQTRRTFYGDPNHFTWTFELSGIISDNMLFLMEIEIARPSDILSNLSSILQYSSYKIEHNFMRHAENAICKVGPKFPSSCQFLMSGLCQISGSVLIRTIESTHTCTDPTVVMQKQIGSSSTGNRLSTMCSHRSSPLRSWYLALVMRTMPVGLDHISTTMQGLWTTIMLP